MTITNKIKNMALSLGLGAIVLTGCASHMNKAIKTLNVCSPSEVVCYSGGYKTSPDIALGIDVLAGVVDGYVPVRKSENGYIINAEGYNCLNADLRTVRFLLITADDNFDKIISKDEYKNLANLICRNTVNNKHLI